MTEGKAVIDRMRDAEGCLDRSALRSILPYGDEFLFVDRVTLLTSDQIEALYSVPSDVSFMRAHFEGLPIMPGVLVGEGLAQAGTLLVRYNLERQESKDILAYQIESASFPAPARPGERLTFRVRLDRLRRGAARLVGEAAVGDRLVCRARLVLAIVERNELRSRLEALADT